MDHAQMAITLIGGVADAQRLGVIDPKNRQTAQI
jgi:hypothetical protein